MTGIDLSLPDQRLPWRRRALTPARATVILAAAVLAAGLSVPGLPTAAAQRASADDVLTTMPVLDAQIAARINAVRAQNGLGRLRLSPRLRSAASLHSFEMVRRGYFSHDSADGSSPWKRLTEFYSPAGYRRWQIGETLLWYAPGVDAAGAVQDWLHSPEHRAILLSPSFEEIGVSALHATAASGYFEGQEVTVITADFGVRTH
jgi:uncharacterized protein YkwD